MRGEELISSDVILGKLSADIRISQTGTNFLPASRSCNMVSEPGGVATETIFLVTPARNVVASIWTSHNEGEYKKEEKKSDEDSHTEKEKSQKALFVPVSTDEAGKGNKED